MKGIHVIIWVADSAATEARVQESSDLLRDFLQLKVTNGIPILFVANKQVSLKITSVRIAQVTLPNGSMKLTSTPL